VTIPALPRYPPSIWPVSSMVKVTLWSFEASLPRSITSAWRDSKSVMKNYPDIKILDAKHGNWNRDDAFKVMQDYLTRFKQIDAVWTGDDDMSVGVLKAIDQAKRDDIKIVLGGAGSKGMIKTLSDGSNPLIQANVTYSPKMIYDAIRMTTEARLKGEKLPEKTLIPSVRITKENAKEFYYPDSPF
jgi:ribose transport system substrate-binding protein